MTLSKYELYSCLCPTRGSYVELLAVSFDMWVRFTIHLGVIHRETLMPKTKSHTIILKSIQLEIIVQALSVFLNDKCC